MKKTHKQKVKMAKNMLSRKERLLKTPIFLSKQWVERAKSIRVRVAK